MGNMDKQENEQNRRRNQSEIRTTTIHMTEKEINPELL
jgi:hypothetical protein